MRPGASNIFESVNLASTLGSIKTPIHSRIPESTSGTSEEDELDPEDFLSPQSPQVRRMELFPKDNGHTEEIPSKGAKTNVNDISQSISKFESSFFSPTASFSLGNLTISTNTIREDSPSEHILRNNALITRELHKNIKHHKRALIKGDTNLNRIRESIAHNFKQLSENHYALLEIYTKENSRLEKLLETFLTWDQRRSVNLEKIQSIKGSDSSDGSKLTVLLDESASIDEQILQLEAHIAKLKSKKQVIASEIDMTTSVLESKTSVHVQEFRNLEAEVQKGISEVLTVDGLSESALSSLVKFVPVDVTFSKSYNPRPKVPNPIIVERIPAELNEITKNTTNGNGEQRTPLHGKPEGDHSILNHEHGPTPFQRGYFKGSNLSGHIKAQLQKLLATWASERKEPTPNTESWVRIDDSSNTISEKVDLRPIKALLESKIASFEVQRQSHSSQATTFHHHHTLWRDCLEILRAHEKKLELQILESTSTNFGEKQFVGIMTSALNRVNSAVDYTYKEHPEIFTSNDRKRGYVIRCLQHEVEAIVSALTVVDLQNDYSRFLNMFRGLTLADMSSTITSTSS